MTTSILHIVSLYLAQLTFGSAILLPFYPNRVAGKTFPQFYYGMILIFFGLFLGCLWRLDQFSINHVSIFAMGLVLFALSFTKEFSKGEENLHFLFAFISLAWSIVYFNKYSLPHEDIWTAIPLILAFCVSMLFLSGHVMNMIFGHWYLVNRQLPIQHLIKACFNILLLTVLRILITLVSIYWAYTHMDAETWMRLTDFLGHGIFFWARILAGLGVPALVSVLAYQSAKIGSNQSATGIMYAGCVFVLMGEFLALYLFALTGYFF